ncbi:hypothetical protein BABINDRAFT_163946 [Babjeviella inositovora NRRL Y-12698]|uniref:Uncharacterized protein n=1 Tax=Babjeviella inositovora NRRL Y-12698 TaxID=984486 RepID=A0A1E3QHM7_9ASCO|nr:uncharacterized protein BABINDRAFT_163946 [Babjeviella inositovora NRRL Y-12698]ODQ76944.1 hypothetical protein BABINDRAFT_163946 [Babjeviella inositovora NRRL Y-12698]
MTSLDTHTNYEYGLDKENRTRKEFPRSTPPQTPLSRTSFSQLNRSPVKGREEILLIIDIYSSKPVKNSAPPKSSGIQLRPYGTQRKGTPQITFGTPQRALVQAKSFGLSQTFETPQVTFGSQTPFTSYADPFHPQHSGERLQIYEDPDLSRSKLGSVNSLVSNWSMTLPEPNVSVSGSPLRSKFGSIYSNSSRRTSHGQTVLSEASFDFGTPFIMEEDDDDSLSTASEASSVYQTHPYTGHSPSSLAHEESPETELKKSGGVPEFASNADLASIGLLHDNLSETALPRSDPCVRHSLVIEDEMPLNATDVSLSKRNSGFSAGPENVAVALDLIDESVVMERFSAVYMGSANRSQRPRGYREAGGSEGEPPIDGESNQDRESNQQKGSKGGAYPEDTRRPGDENPDRSTENNNPGDGGNGESGDGNGNGRGNGRGNGGDGGTPNHPFTPNTTASSDSRILSTDSILMSAGSFRQFHLQPDRLSQVPTVEDVRLPRTRTHTREPPPRDSSIFAVSRELDRERLDWQLSEFTKRASVTQSVETAELYHPYLEPEEASPNTTSLSEVTNYPPVMSSRSISIKPVVAGSNVVKLVNSESGAMEENFGSVPVLRHFGSQRSLRPHSFALVVRLSHLDSHLDLNFGLTDSDQNSGRYALDTPHRRSPSHTRPVSFRKSRPGTPKLLFHGVEGDLSSPKPAYSGTSPNHTHSGRYTNPNVTTESLMTVETAAVMGQNMPMYLDHSPPYSIKRGVLFARNSTPPHFLAPIPLDESLPKAEPKTYSDIESYHSGHYDFYDMYYPKHSTFYRDHISSTTFVAIMVFALVCPVLYMMVYLGSFERSFGHFSARQRMLSFVFGCVYTAVALGCIGIIVGVGVR